VHAPTAGPSFQGDFVDQEDVERTLGIRTDAGKVRAVYRHFVKRLMAACYDNLKGYGLTREREYFIQTIARWDWSVSWPSRICAGLPREANSRIHDGYNWTCWLPSIRGLVTHPILLVVRARNGRKSNNENGDNPRLHAGRLQGFGPR